MRRNPASQICLFLANTLFFHEKYQHWLHRYYLRPDHAWLQETKAEWNSHSCLAMSFYAWTHSADGVRQPTHMGSAEWCFKPSRILRSSEKFETQSWMWGSFMTMLRIPTLKWRYSAFLSLLWPLFSMCDDPVFKSANVCSNFIVAEK